MREVLDEPAGVLDEVFLRLGVLAGVTSIALALWTTVVGRVL